MEYTIVDLEKTTQLELSDAIEQNRKTAKLMRQEIDKLKQANKSYELNKKEEKEEAILLIEEEKNKMDSDNDFFNEVDYYFNFLDIINLSDNIKEEIRSILPSDKKTNYDNIIMCLKMGLLKNIKDIKDLLEEEKEALSKEDLEEFKAEINLNQKKIDIITEIEKDNTTTSEKSLKNNLFFVTTAGGNARVIDEINDMDVDYLESFKGLFESITDGTFKNVKRFNSNNKISGISEVKDFKTRVVFDRIGKYDYAIITAFTKKSNNDKGYLISLELKIKNYLNQKEKMISLLNNDDFRKENHLLEQELYNKLSISNKEKELRKEK